MKKSFQERIDNITLQDTKETIAQLRADVVSETGKLAALKKEGLLFMQGLRTQQEEIALAWNLLESEQDRILEENIILDAKENYIKEIEEISKGLLTEIELKRNKAESEYSALLSKIGEQEQLKLSLTKSIEKEKDKVLEIGGTIEEQSEGMKELLSLYDKEIESRIILIKSAEKEYAEIKKKKLLEEKQLREIIENKIKEESVIKSIYSGLKEREADIQKREKNYNIIYRRLKKNYEKVFPDVNIDKLL